MGSFRSSSVGQFCMLTSFIALMTLIWMFQLVQWEDGNDPEQMKTATYLVNSPVSAVDDLARLIQNQVRGDDPELVQLVRAMIENPDPDPQLKIVPSRFVQTPQSKVVDKVLKRKYNGFFVESGAFDGETSSNSIYLEKKRHWTGLLVEMDKHYYMQLRGKNRRAHSIHACVTPLDHPSQLAFETPGEQRGRLVVDNTTEPDQPLVEAEMIKHEIACLPLETMLLALGRTQVDYWSLDVEGLELEVLKNTPLDRLDISVISVEYKHVPEGEEALTQYMESQGYVAFKKLDGKDIKHLIWVADIIYVKKALVP